MTTQTRLDIKLQVAGLPAPQGSKRHIGNGVMLESSKKVKPWRKQVHAAALTFIASERTRFPLDGPLLVDMVFSMPRPKGHYGTGRNAQTLKLTAPVYPTTMPDLSKLARSTEDALTTSGFWVDDSRVVRYGLLEKRYVDLFPDPFDEFARSAPGVVIVVRGVEVAR